MKTVNQQHSQKMTINTRCPADELLKVKDGSSQRISYVQHCMDNPLKAAAQLHSNEMDRRKGKKEKTIK